MPDAATPAVRKLNRNIAIAGSVVLFHVAALWALQSGLLRRAVEIVVPVQILSELVTPPAPKVEPPPAPPAPKPPQPLSKPTARKVERVVPPAPTPVAIPETRPAPDAPTGVPAPQRPAPPVAAPVAPEPAPSGQAPAQAKVELPSSDARYLRNPAPVYPPLSKRLGEQGKVVVRVLIGADGTPQKAELKRSSGYDRLDQSAVEYVMNCRYVPGKVDGVPQSMWYEAPVSFVLE
ncbi:MAG TPA: energy transducer TonB [Ramlibacter sp.]